MQRPEPAQIGPCVACRFGSNPCRALQNRLFFRALHVIRLGIVGSNYGRTVQLPAFRADPRCEVMALAGSDAARTAELARAADVPKAYGDWRALVEDPGSRRLPSPPCRPAGADRAPRARTRQAGVRREADGQHARRRARHAAPGEARPPAHRDRFQFPPDHELAARQGDARRRRDRRAAPRRACIGTSRSRAIQMRMRNWKTLSDDGGGVLGNFISHCFHYLEWFCGPIAGLSARFPACPDDKRSANDGSDGDRVQRRAAGEPVHELRVVSRQRASHRILRRGRHAGAAQSGRRLHARLRIVLRQAAGGGARPHSGRSIRSTRNIRTAASRRCRGSPSASSTPSKAAAPRRPDFAAGYRVQQLIDAAQRSHRQGVAIESPPTAAGEERRR